MASRKIGEKKIQINTTGDEQKSMEDLFKIGLKNFKDSSRHYQRNKDRGQLPPSFGIKPKSRNSSVGHSREGSSDDGFGSSGRQTLSPSSISGNVQAFHPYHSRQTSAPAFIEYNNMDQHPSSSGSSRTMASCSFKSKLSYIIVYFQAFHLLIKLSVLRQWQTSLQLQEWLLNSVDLGLPTICHINSLQK